MTSASQRPTTKQLKTIRKAIRHTYNTKDSKQKWDEIYINQGLQDAYGRDPNKKNSKIGKEATSHLLDSDALRDELSEHTPIDHPSIIPPNCTLRFFYSLSQYTALSHPINLSQCFDNVDQMRSILNDRLYSSKLTINIAGTNHDFWVKSMKQSGTAFVRAFGIQVSDYIMRYRPAIYVELGPVIMELSGKNIGVGFCNLTKSNKGVQGHQMIHLEMETMDTVYIRFYCPHDVRDLSMHDISVHVKTYQQKKKQIIATKDAPFVLFDGTYIHGEGEIVQYEDTAQLTPHELMNNTCVIPPLMSIPHHSDGALFPDNELRQPSSEYMEWFNDSHSVSTVSPLYRTHHTDNPFTLPTISSPNVSPNYDSYGMEHRSWRPKYYRIFQGVGTFNNPRNGMHRSLIKRRPRLNVSKDVKYMRTKPVIQPRV